MVLCVSEFNFFAYTVCQQVIQLDVVSQFFIKQQKVNGMILVKWLEADDEVIKIFCDS